MIALISSDNIAAHTFEHGSTISPCTAAFITYILVYIYSFSNQAT